MSNRASSTDLVSDTAINGAGGFDVVNGGPRLVLNANRQRIVLFLTNPSDTDMFIGLGKDPVSSVSLGVAGIFLAKLGGSLVIDNWIGDVRAIHEAATP